MISDLIIPPVVVTVLILLLMGLGLVNRERQVKRDTLVVREERVSLVVRRVESAMTA